MVFSTLWPQAGFLTPVCERTQSIQSIKSNKLSKVVVILKTVSLGALFECPRLSVYDIVCKLILGYCRTELSTVLLCLKMSYVIIEMTKRNMITSTA